MKRTIIEYEASLFFKALDRKIEALIRKLIPKGVLMNENDLIQETRQTKKEIFDKYLNEVLLKFKDPSEFTEEHLFNFIKEFFHQPTQATPNKKYTPEMFELTSALLYTGKKDYVAYEETLEKYGFDKDKADSYRKRYKNYLKEK